MATLINEHFLLIGEAGMCDIEFYKTDKDKIFAVDIVDERFFFVIEKEDWEELKKFIDEQLNSL